MKTKERSKVSKKFWTLPHADTGTEVGLYYGFSLSDTPAIEKADKDCTKDLKGACPAASLSVRPEECAVIVRKHFAKNIPQLPVVAFYERGAIEGHRKDPKKVEYRLDILGTTKAIADATIIKTCYEIIREEGYADIIVEINTLGDRESMARFSREMVSFSRKNIAELDPECRQLLKKDPLAILDSCKHDKCGTIKDSAPRPINYLSDFSRLHFKELLEFLEITEIPYTLNSTLIENSDFVSHTIFKIYGTETGKTERHLVAAGMRWCGIGKRMGLKKDVPGVSATVLVQRKKPQKTPLKFKKPECYFVQMGQEAKLKSLNVIELLRQSKILVYHSLAKDKLTAQLLTAEHLRVPFLLIMGQKESIENTVLVRDTNDSSQETIRIPSLATYLKKVLP